MKRFSTAAKANVSPTFQVGEQDKGMFTISMETLGCIRATSTTTKSALDTEIHLCTMQLHHRICLNTKFTRTATTFDL